MDVADMMRLVISGLQEERNNFPRHVVFTRTIRECAALYNALRLQLPGLQHLQQMYHSCTLNRIKESITADMASNTGQIRTLVCTNAAGMGVNFKGVSHVVNFGSPIELDTFVLQVELAGRDDQFQHAAFLYSATDSTSDEDTDEDIMVTTVIANWWILCRITDDDNTHDGNNF
ncbi:uncharacterized protein [Argopecten irradians]|uniref:uncharacterized protein n=1 Tax=Argopecten irradians TaxID=31199 RepID=UPI00371F0A59